MISAFSNGDTQAPTPRSRSFAQFLTASTLTALSIASAIPMIRLSGSTSPPSSGGLSISPKPTWMGSTVAKTLIHSRILVLAQVLSEFGSMTPTAAQSGISVRAP